MNFLLSGYFGFDNFGDDAILKVIVDDLKNNVENANITIISGNPTKTKVDYKADSIYTFDYKSIFKKMKNIDVLISGGGSLLQDVTSVKSLIYYLLVILTALIFNKKVMVYAQGIGPISNPLGYFLTKLILKQVDLITVRDKKSQNFLKNMGINSTLTADPVWNLSYTPSNIEKNQKRIGIQLREWHSLDENKLNSLADSIITNFDAENTEFVIISLQDTLDLEVNQSLLDILKTKKPEINVHLEHDLSINKSLEILNSLDLLIGMRFHACLAAIGLGIPTCSISYDPKVEILAEEANIPNIPVNLLDNIKCNSIIKDFVENSEQYKQNLVQYSEKKQKEARQNTELLLKIVLKQFN